MTYSFITILFLASFEISTKKCIEIMITKLVLTKEQMIS